MSKSKDPGPAADDLEAQLTETLSKIVGEKARHVSFAGDTIYLHFIGGPKDERSICLQIEPPWRIIQDGEITVGSRDAYRASGNQQRLAAVRQRSEALLGAKVESFEIFDFELQLADGTSLEHFANSTGTDDSDFFVSVEDSAFKNTTYQLGLGWITEVNS